MSYVIVYVVTLVTSLVLDGIWLSTTNKRIYQPVMGPLMEPHFRVAPAAAFYLLYPVALMIFVTIPAMKAGSFGHALVFGALFGASVYMTYDLTNFATLKSWTLQLSLIDIAWGTVLSAAACSVAYLVAPMLGVKFS